MATPHVKVSAIAFSADEKTEEAFALAAGAEAETVSFDAGALSVSGDCGSAAGVVVSDDGLLSVAAFPRREERFGLRVQKTTWF